MPRTTCSAARADIRHYLQEDTAFPGDRLFRDAAYRLAPDYRALLDDAIGYASERVSTATGRREQRVAWWSAIALLRSLVSSPRAAAQTLLTRSQTAAAATADEADLLGRPVAADMADDNPDGIDASPGADDTIAPVPSRLRELAARAAGLEGPEQDKKLALLIKTVRQLLDEGYHPIVFCRYIPTSEYVAEHLDGKLGRKTLVEFVNGTLSPAQRQGRIEELARRAEEDGGARRVLVATDCLSEGVNLQHHFNAVVHYDLAWNPTRHEQREGRVDRFGQRTDNVKVVTIYGGDNGIDGKVLEVLIKKHREIRKSTGISVPIPDETSSKVTDAIVEWLLLRDRSDQQALFDFDEVVGKTDKDLDEQWNSMAERERRSRSRFAQGSIHEEDVAPEVAAIRAALGRDDEVRAFAKTALTALGGDITTAPGGGFTVTTASLPARPAGLHRRADRRATAHPLPDGTGRRPRRGRAYPHRPGGRHDRELRAVYRPGPRRARPAPPRPPLWRHPHHRGHHQDHAAARPLPVPAHPPRSARRPAADRRGRPRPRLRRRLRPGQMARR